MTLTNDQSVASAAVPLELSFPQALDGQQGQQIRQLLRQLS
jgi:hypothetical protein